MPTSIWQVHVIVIIMFICVFLQLHTTQICCWSDISSYMEVFWHINVTALCPRHCETLHYTIGSLSAIISSRAVSLKLKQRDIHSAGLISSPPSNYWHKAPLWAHTVLLPLKQHMKTQTHTDKCPEVSDTHMQMHKHMSINTCKILDKHEYVSIK